MRISESKGVRNWVAVLLLCVLIFLPSLVHLPMPRGPFNDKVAHLLVYAVVGFLVLRGARSLPLGQSRVAAVCFAFLVAVLIGMADEVHQLFVPRRSMDRVDFLCDIVGVTCGIVLYVIVWLREDRNVPDRSPTD
ncbi:VanZ family protein [Desulfoluna spongiiphila]|uniref:VanZ like family protein n=1 Tax=Desulfoluna spongiiphila TaxID=419481 RepID=A0A1G5AGQ2_9BACT|nr:VanZ family protein [Desulfoluna spongiiphila]SCX77045.1 VanZ like family protein [Desulfoluna spongiiphila]VVS90604.1 vanz-like [Desulfoluna spongiiphila]